MGQKYPHLSNLTKGKTIYYCSLLNGKESIIKEIPRRKKTIGKFYLILQTYKIL